MICIKCRERSDRTTIWVMINMNSIATTSVILLNNKQQLINT